MLSYAPGIVKKILCDHTATTEILVEMKGKESKAINYTALTGPVEMGDRVVLNTTAVELQLGSGGMHFVLYNERHSTQPLQGPGHIMKLRYTPMQIKVLAAEEQKSPFHHHFLQFEHLDGFPVLVGELHSMLIPLVCTLKYTMPSLKIAYIMTDGAALPIHLSHAVRTLKEQNLLDTTITIGHAFGGDLECVNIYNGLIAAKEVAQCHIAIVTMGPGIVGTGTAFGFTGIEQGGILNAVHQLNGHGILVPRISFCDSRARHEGISHHTMMILEKIVSYATTVVLPKLEDSRQQEFIRDQINHLKITQKHNIVEVDGNLLKEALSHFEMEVSTMGRNYEKDPVFFLSCGAAAVHLFMAMKNRK